jgi:hypothetical protein
MVDEEWNPQILMNLPVYKVPGCISCNTKTLGLQHLQLLDMAVSTGPPDQAYIVHHMMDELLIKHHAISDGQATSPVKEGARHTQSLSCLSSWLTCAA